MNFNFLFGIVGNLNFIIEFAINEKEHQDFFLFEGVNSSAHLHRFNQTIYLQLSNGNETSLYQTDFENMLEYSWIGFKVNGTEMNKIKSDGDLSLKFDAFTFLSPLVNFSYFDDLNEEKLLNSNNLSGINYGYIVGIVLIIAIVFDFKPKTWKLMKSMLNNLEKSDNDGTYDTLRRSETVIQEILWQLLLFMKLATIVSKRHVDPVKPLRFFEIVVRVNRMDSFLVFSNCISHLS